MHMQGITHGRNLAANSEQANMKDYPHTYTPFGRLKPLVSGSCLQSM